MPVMPFVKMRVGLFEAKHYRRMGMSIWLYAWMWANLDWNTNSLKWNLGEVAEHYDVTNRCVEKWHDALKHHGYVKSQTERGSRGFIRSQILKFVDPRERGESSVESRTQSRTQSRTELGLPTREDSYKSESSDSSESKDVVVDEQRAAFGRVKRHFENNIALATGVLLETLETALAKYGETWVTEAISEAARRGAKNWSYIAAILENWFLHGYKSEKPQRKPRPKESTHEKPSRPTEPPAVESEAARRLRAAGLG
jgi:DnaD/phage-associated family protein